MALDIQFHINPSCGKGGCCNGHKRIVNVLLKV